MFTPVNFRSIVAVLFCIAPLFQSNALAGSQFRYRVLYEYDGKAGEAQKTQVEVWFNPEGVISARAFVGNEYHLIRAKLHQSADGTFNVTFDENSDFLKLRSLHLDSRLRVLSASAIYVDTCSLNLRDFKEQRKGRTLYYGRTSDYSL